MNIEIERKFLVKDPSIIQQAESFDEITQGYFLTEKGISIRIRLKNKLAFLCIKGRVEMDNGLIRNEFEYEIPFEDGEFMLHKFCSTRVVSKKRYYLMQNELRWEIDVFEGRHAPLIIAEVDLADPGSRGGHALEIEHPGVDDFLQGHVAEVAGDDFRVGLQGAYDLAYPFQFGG